ncbi:FHA domain-containing protein [Paenibacillus sp. PSB04]|uniref:FHA domain-containing protein n=1 Tax=Paenibacillus sp. PSB04 TaxID=2866810 RepID=UPI0021F0DF47|nr:FHA domain-containing protein [Paenibacillus sp. PSB04]UYO04773.1 FHA domain-containing protein [Paenibacillus sp. PSB04]
MNTGLESLTRDFIQHDGTFMVIGPAEGYRPDELNNIELSMISASRIARFLPLRLKEMDLRVTLQYDITGKKMLSHVLRGERLSMPDYYGLLCQVAGTLEESKSYMLQPDKYVLDEDYIFVDGSLHSGTLYFTYVPLEEPFQDKPLRIRLKELVTRLMATVQELKGNGVQRLLQFTGGEDFSVSGFKKLLLELLTAEEDDGHGYADHPGGGQPLEGYQDHTQQAYRKGLPGGIRVPGKGIREAEDSAAGSVVPFQTARTNARAAEGDRLRSVPLQQADRQGLERDSFPGVGGLQEAFDHWNRNPDRDDALDANDEREANGKSGGKIYIALGCLLCAAVIWRMIYMPKPTTSSLLISILLTILLGVAAWLSWSGKLKLGRSAQQAMEGEIPDFGSCEIDDDRHAASRKRIPRFQVEQLTGWFGKGSRRKDRDDDDHGTDDAEPDWKWKFSQDVLASSTGIELRGGGQRTSETSGPSYSAVGSNKKGLGLGSGVGIGQEGRDGREGRGGREERENREGRETPADREHYSDIRQRLWSHLETTHAAGIERAANEHAGSDGSAGHDFRLKEGQAMSGTGRSHATVLLSAPVDGAAGGKSRRSGSPGYYLIREGEGRPSERIELTLPHFVIGRSEEVAQYVEASTGTSRAHVELARSKDGGYLIKDLGSRNGTKLHGEPMVPYKEYPLKDGDTFTIISGVYTFKVS